MTLEICTPNMKQERFHVFKRVNEKIITICNKIPYGNNLCPDHGYELWFRTDLSFVLSFQTESSTTKHTVVILLDRQITGRSSGNLHVKSIFN